MNLRNALYLAVFWLLAGNVPAVARDGWIAYGDLRGHVEPCGCDPATDLGGIRRLATVIARERTLDPTIAVFSLGNNVSAEPKDNLKSRTILEAEAVIAPTARLLNLNELKAPELVKSAVAGAGRQGPAFVISNAGRNRPAYAAEFVRNERFLILGYTFDNSDRLPTAQVSKTMLAAWKELIRRHGQQRKTVLLFSGGQEDLRTVTGERIFDIVISSNTASTDREPGTEERQNETLLRRLDEPGVLMVPLGGQGILRGGELAFREAKSIQQVLGEKPACLGGSMPGVFGGCGPDGGILKRLKLVTWLDPSVENSPLIDPVYARFQDGVRAAFKAGLSARESDLKSSPYAGAAACIPCHQKQHEIYTATKHPQAMAVLIAKEKQQDSECVACHALGASQKGGFVSMELSPAFAGVQCESCHGPRLAHTKNPVPPPKEQASAKTVCIGCHTGPHSPEFDLSVYWDRIKH